MSRREVCPKCDSTRTAYRWKGNRITRRCQDCRARWDDGTIFNGAARSRAHPDREYRIGPGDAIWRKDTYEARFGRPNTGKWHGGGR